MRPFVARFVRVAFRCVAASRFTAPLIASLCVASMPVGAQTVYRCGNTYSHLACADAHVVDAADHRSPAERAAAFRSVQADRRLASEMRHDRLADEHGLRPGGPANLGPVVTATPAPRPSAVRAHAQARQRRSLTAPDLRHPDFIAIDPTTRRKPPAS